MYLSTRRCRICSMRPSEPSEKTPLEMRYSAAVERAETLDQLELSNDPDDRIRQLQARAILALGMIVRGSP